MFGPHGTIVAWCVLNLSVCAFGMAIAYTFLYRLAAIYNSTHWVTNKWAVVLMAIGQAGFGWPTTSMVLVVHEREDFNREYIRQVAQSPIHTV